ncbi:ABC transporter substrate-binding protein [Fusobacterium sp.]|uniref:ABC transporter substrate-binding protein n=1 Tax=Fusobacterium sp. TaxID=68766 RepID=UPI0025C04D6C|nr:ABC transporter substrate-binding protein [Fusobacterium sp.]
MKKYLILILLLLFVGCDGLKEKDVNNRILKVALAYKPRSFDPHRHTDSATLAVTKQIYSNLFSIDNEGNIVTELVESYQIQEDSSIILRLKKGVLFHNEKEMKAEDVKRSLERNLEIPVSRVLVEAIESVEVIDDYTLKIIQNNSPSILLHNLAHSSTAIVKEVAKNSQDIDLVGTGPYKIEDWSLSERVVLKGFDKFYGEKARVKDLIFQTIPETSNRLIALETGEIDIAYDISANDIKGIKKNPKLKVINEVSLGSDFITINTKRIKDKRIRQAIEYAIDKKAIINTVYEGYGIAPKSILSPNVFGYDAESEIREYNPDRAKELLKEAEVENLKLGLWIYDEPSRQQMAQIIQANLKELGIDVEINVLEVSSFLQYTGMGEHDLLIGLWYVSTGDADYGFYPLLHSSSAGPVGNRSFYSNVEVDNLLNRARKTTSTLERKENYKKVQNIINDEVPLFPIAYKNYTIGLQNNINGFLFNPNGNHILYKVYYEKN